LDHQEEEVQKADYYMLEKIHPAAVGTLTPGYADVVRSTDGSVVSQPNQYDTHDTHATNNVDEEKHQ
jgi:hypothetical protein